MATTSVTITVPQNFTLPPIFQCSDPTVVANALSFAAGALSSGRRSDTDVRVLPSRTGVDDRQNSIPADVPEIQNKELSKTGVLDWVATHCPDSHVRATECEGQIQRGIWTRFFGSTNLAMRCALLVVDVDDVQPQHIDALRQACDLGDDVNCGMLFSLCPTSMPLCRGASRYHPRFSIEWKEGVPMILTSHIRDNPEMIGVCMAIMQQVWLYCDRERSIGVGESSGISEEQLQLINNFVNEQYDIHRRNVEAHTEWIHQLQGTLRFMTRAKEEHQRQLANIAERITGSLGPRVQLNCSSSRTRRRRTGEVTAEANLSQAQREIVTACQQYIRSHNNRMLRAKDINAGVVDGVTKFAVDSHFGNFTSLKLTLRSIEDTSTRTLSSFPTQTE